MALSDNAKHVIGTVAQTLGTALGGPFGALAGTAIAQALGVKPGDDKAIDAAVTSGDPDILLKLKQADQDFAVKMEQLGIDRDKLVYDDRANARAREMSVKDTTPRNLAYILICATTGLIFIEALGWSRAESALMGTLIGYLISECKAALQYYFGTTLDSGKKTDVISDIAQQP